MKENTPLNPASKVKQSIHWHIWFSLEFVTDKPSTLMLTYIDLALVPWLVKGYFNASQSSQRKANSNTNKTALIYSFQIVLDIDSQAVDDIREWKAV